MATAVPNPYQKGLVSHVNSLDISQFQQAQGLQHHLNQLGSQQSSAAMQLAQQHYANQVAQLQQNWVVQSPNKPAVPADQVLGRGVTYVQNPQTGVWDKNALKQLMGSGVAIGVDFAQEYDAEYNPEEKQINSLFRDLKAWATGERSNPSKKLKKCLQALATT